MKYKDYELLLYLYSALSIVCHFNFNIFWYILSVLLFIYQKSIYIGIFLETFGLVIHLPEMLNWLNIRNILLHSLFWWLLIIGTVLNDGVFWKSRIYYLATLPLNVYNLTDFRDYNLFPGRYLSNLFNGRVQADDACLEITSFRYGMWCFKTLIETMYDFLFPGNDSVLSTLNRQSI